MSKWNFLALTLGLLLVAAPFTKHQFALADEYDDDDDEDDAPAAPKDDDVDVVVVTTKNWDETVKKSKFALVE
jgi:protein disulfide-isomerase A1